MRLTRRSALAAVPALGGVSGCARLRGPIGDCSLGRVTGSWAQPGGGPGHAGHRPDAAGPPDPGVAWETTVADAGSPRIAGIAVFDGTLYVLGVERPDEDPDGFHRAYDAATGAPAGGGINSDEAVRSPPAVTDGGVLHAARDDDGTSIAVSGLRREYPLGREAGGREVAAPAVDGGRVVAGSLGGGVVSFDMDGGFGWRRTLDGRIRSPVALADGTAYVAAGDGGLHALRLADGTTRWRDDRRAIGPPVAAGGTVTVRDGRRLRAFDPDGTERWTAGAFGDGTSPPAVTGDAVYHVDGTHAYCRRLADGSERWRRPVEAPARRQPLVGDDHLFVPEIGGVTAFALPYGERRWQVDGTPVAAPALVGDALFCPAADGRVRAIGACE
ncbi:MAG: PQQ-binding-like beta-propeller repeat protein [Haloarculaceae archaeon]